MEKHDSKSDLIAVNLDEHPTRKKVYNRNLGNFGSAILYGVCSVSMAFINKTVLSSFNFNFPFFIMAYQMMLTILFLEVLRKFCDINVLKYSLKLGFSFAWPSIFYALHSITALYALSGMSIPMYAAVKRCGPIVTLFLSVILLRKAVPNHKIIISVILISGGCILAGLGDLQFDLQAYVYGAFSVLVQGLYLTLSQKHLENLSTLNVLYLNSFNTCFFFIGISILLECEEILQYNNFTDLKFLCCLVIQSCMGVLLNYSLFLCTAKNSALTTSLVGVIKSVLQTLIGFFTFGGVTFTHFNVLGIILNLSGGIMYSYLKYDEKTKRKMTCAKPI